MLTFASDLEIATYVAEHPNLLKIAIKMAEYEGHKTLDANEEANSLLSQTVRHLLLCIKIYIMILMAIKCLKS